MLRKNQLLLAGAGLAAAALLAWALAPRPVAVEIATVARGHYEQAIEEDGRTRVKQRYTVSAPLAGRVMRITLDEGDRVQAGDRVAVLLPVLSSMVDERSTREAQARVLAATANVAGATARLERARVGVEEARLDLGRTQKLAGEGYVSASKLDSARLALAAAQRELDAAVAGRTAAVHDQAQAEAALLPPGSGAAQGQPLTVRSPVSGLVLRVAQESEATVLAGAPLVDIGDPTQLEVIAELLTTDAVQAQPGRRVVFERWGGPAVQGRVRLVEPGAFTKVSALGIEEQRVKVVMDTGEAPAAWRAMGDGFRVTVRVITQEIDDAVLAPVGALFPIADGGVGVYVVEGGRAHLRPVELGGRNGSEGWIRAGLKPGQEVIIYPPPAVSDGERVERRRE
jgi:HlyD family secretion protein